MAEFKDMLYSLRKARGYSQSELAKKIGVSASTIGNYEQGTRTPAFEIEESIADLFNVSLDVLRGKSPGYDIKENEDFDIIIENYLSMSEASRARLIDYSNKLVELEKMENMKGGDDS